MMILADLEVFRSTGFMTVRSSVNFSDKVGPLIKKYGRTYGIKNTCSLGVILIDHLSPELREQLMDFVGSEAHLDTVRGAITFAENKAIRAAIEAQQGKAKQSTANKKNTNQ